MPTKKLNRRLSMERLDARNLMAGDVSVQIVKDEIIINGDNRANQIVVQQVGANQFSVTGLNGTKVNGRSSGVFTSKSHDIRANMANGNDELWIGAELSKSAMELNDLTVDMGKGSDLLAVINLNARDDEPTVLNMGTNSDSSLDADIFFSDKFYVEDDLEINTGSGKDVLEMHNTRVDGKASVNMGDGADHVEVHDSIFAASDFNGGAGSDVIKRVRSKINFRNF